MRNVLLISALAQSLTGDEVRAVEASLINRKKLGVKVYDLDSIIPPDADAIDVVNVFNGLIRTAIGATSQNSTKFLSGQGDVLPPNEVPTAESPLDHAAVVENAIKAADSFQPVMSPDVLQPVIVPGVSTPTIVAQTLKEVDTNDAIKDVLLKAAVAKPPVETAETLTLSAVNTDPATTDAPIVTESKEVIVDPKASAQVIASIAMKEAVAQDPKAGIPVLAESPAALEVISTRVAQEFGEDKNRIKELLKMPIMSTTTFNAIAGKPSPGAISRFQAVQGDLKLKRHRKCSCVVGPGTTSPFIKMPMSPFSFIKHAPMKDVKRPFMKTRSGEGDLDSILGTIGGWFINDISNAMAEIIRKKPNPTPAEVRRLKDYDRQHAAADAKEASLMKSLNDEANSMDAQELGRLADKIVEHRKDANAREYKLAADDHLTPRLQYSMDDLDPYKIHPIMVARIEDIKNAYQGTRDAINNSVQQAANSGPNSTGSAVQASDLPGVASAAAENLGNSAIPALLDLSSTNPVYNVMASSAVNSQAYEDWMNPSVINQMAMSMSATMERALAEAKMRDAEVANTTLKLARVRHIVALLQADYQVIGMLKNSPLDFSSPENYIKSLLYSVRHLNNIGALTPFKGLISSMKDMEDTDLLDQSKRSWFGDVRGNRGSGDIFLGDIHGQGDLDFQAVGDLKTLLSSARENLDQPKNTSGDGPSVAGALAATLDGAGKVAKEAGARLGPEGKVLAAILGTLVAAKTFGPAVGSYLANKRGGVKITGASYDAAGNLVAAADNAESTIKQNRDAVIKAGREDYESLIHGDDPDDLTIPADQPYRWLQVGRGLADSRRDDEWLMMPQDPADLLAAGEIRAYEGGFFDSIKKVVKSVASIGSKIVNSPIVKTVAGFIPGATDVLGVAQNVSGFADKALGFVGLGPSGGKSTSAPSTTISAPVGYQQMATAPEQALNTVMTNGSIPLMFPAPASSQVDAPLKTTKTKELLLTRMFVDDEGKVVGIKDIYRDDVMLGDITHFDTSMNVISTFSVGMPVFDVPKYATTAALKTPLAVTKEVHMTPKVTLLKDMTVDKSLSSKDFSSKEFNLGQQVATGDVSVPVQTLPGSVPGTTIQLVRVGGGSSMSGNSAIVPNYTPKMAANNMAPTFADASEFHATNDDILNQGNDDSDSIEAWEDEIAQMAGMGEGNIVSSALKWVGPKLLKVAAKLSLAKIRPALVAGLRFAAAHPKMAAGTIIGSYLMYRGSGGKEGGTYVIEGKTLTEDQVEDMLDLAENGMEYWDEQMLQKPIEQARIYPLRYEVLVRKYAPGMPGYDQLEVADTWYGSSASRNGEFDNGNLSANYSEAALISMTLPFRDKTVMENWKKEPGETAINNMKHIQALYSLVIQKDGVSPEYLTRLRATMRTRLTDSINGQTVDTFFKLLTDSQGRINAMKPVYVLMLDALFDFVIRRANLLQVMEEVSAGLGDISSDGASGSSSSNGTAGPLTQEEADAALAMAASGDTSDLDGLKDALNEAGIKKAGAEAKASEGAGISPTAAIMAKVTSFVQSDHFKVLVALIGVTAATAVVAKLLTKGASIESIDDIKAHITAGGNESLTETSGPAHVIRMKYH